MKRLLALGVLTSSLLVVQTQAQEKGMAKPAMETKTAKSKMMEPGMMMAAEKAMMGDKSMIPSMMAKEMLMHDMMHDEKTMAMMQKTTMASEPSKPAMMDDSKVKMAGEKLVADSNELAILFQELVARHLAAQKMAMAKKAPAGAKKMMSPMMNEASIMESRKEIMAGEAMAAMVARESLIQSLMKDPEVMSMVEKQAKKMQSSSMASMIADESLLMKSESMATDPAMVKAVAKDALVRHAMDSAKMTMEAKK